MANVLLQNNQNIPTKSNSLANLLSQAKTLGPSDAVFNQLYASNPKFRELADSVKGMTPEQACAKHGVNFNTLLPFKW